MKTSSIISLFLTAVSVATAGTLSDFQNLPDKRIAVSAEKRRKGSDPFKL